jgi:hypothetical protein
MLAFVCASKIIPKQLPKYDQTRVIHIPKKKLREASSGGGHQRVQDFCYTFQILVCYSKKEIEIHLFCFSDSPFYVIFLPCIVVHMI